MDRYLILKYRFSYNFVTIKKKITILLESKNYDERYDPFSVEMCSDGASLSD